MADSVSPAADAPHPHNPVPFPETRGEIRHLFDQKSGRIWLRGVARVMEWISDLQPKQLNYSDVTPLLAVGGAFHTGQIPRLVQRGVTAVVDCRSEAADDQEALRKAGIDLLHLPAPDKYALSYEQLESGVKWVLAHLENSRGRVFLHCEHGVGRGPLMGCAVLVGQGKTAPQALRIVRDGRWQALPNDRQLRGLLEFEAEWRKRHGEPLPEEPAQ